MWPKEHFGQAKAADVPEPCRDKVQTKYKLRLHTNTVQVLQIFLESNRVNDWLPFFSHYFNYLGTQEVLFAAVDVENNSVQSTVQDGQVLPFKLM